MRHWMKKLNLNNLQIMTEKKASPLKFEILAECKTSKARTGKITLMHHHVDTPVFMPVGTQVHSLMVLYKYMKKKSLLSGFIYMIYFRVL